MDAQARPPRRSGTGENGNREHIGFSFSKEEERREAQGDTERASGWRGLCCTPRPAPLLDDPAWVNVACITISRLGTWKARPSLRLQGHSSWGMTLLPLFVPLWPGTVSGNRLIWGLPTLGLQLCRGSWTARCSRNLFQMPVCDKSLQTE